MKDTRRFQSLVRRAARRTEEHIKIKKKKSNERQLEFINVIVIDVIVTTFDHCVQLSR